LQHADDSHPWRRGAVPHRHDLPARSFFPGWQRDERVDVAQLITRRELLRKRHAIVLRQDADDRERRAADVDRLSED
jgi:hypothetical protein